MDTRIFVMTHKEYNEPREDVYKSLAVGKALNPQLPYMGDDTGDNISEKNRNYCELTGVYWVWKNITCDIIGICHYRRYFVRDNAVLTREQIESTLADFDVIVSRSERTLHNNMRGHYRKCHFEKDLDTCRSVLAELQPDYLSTFDLSFNCNLFTIGNMIITRKDIFDRYCEWLFPILFEVEKRTDISGYEPYQARLYGYLSERLLRVWLLHQPLKVKEEEVRLTDEKELDEKAKSSGIVQHYLEILLKDLITLYKTGNYFDVESIEPLVDFGGKTPAWTCMWKGGARVQAAEHSRLKKIKKNISLDAVQMVDITFENVGNYVKLPSWIVDKFNKGIIKPAQLSDIVQMYVLYAYGGQWFGAGYGAFGGKPEEEAGSRLAGESEDEGSCRAGGLVRCQAGSVQARFVLNALYLYWYQKDEAISEDLMGCLARLFRA
jgi:hypothetical protein